MSNIIQPGDERMNGMMQKLAKAAEQQQQAIQAKANFLVEITVCGIFSNLVADRLAFLEFEDGISKDELLEMGEYAKRYAPFILEVMGLGKVEIKEQSDDH